MSSSKPDLPSLEVSERTEQFYGQSPGKRTNKFQILHQIQMDCKQIYMILHNLQKSFAIGVACTSFVRNYTSYHTKLICALFVAIVLFCPARILEDISNVSLQYIEEGFKAVEQ